MVIANLTSPEVTESFAWFHLFPKCRPLRHSCRGTLRRPYYVSVLIPDKETADKKARAKHLYKVPLIIIRTIKKNNNNMLSLLIAPITALLERIIPDPEKAAEAKAEMMSIMVEANAKEIEAKSKVIIAEAKGESWLQRNWRPIIALSFGIETVIITAFQFIIFPLLGIFGFEIHSLPMPAELWWVNGICITGYIGSRGYEKTTRMKTDKDLFDAARSVNGYLTQEQVDRIKTNGS
jgi:hypothetical protein